MTPSVEGPLDSELCHGAVEGERYGECIADVEGRLPGNERYLDRIERYGGSDEW